MTELQVFLVFIVAILGATFGGLLGYANSSTKFNWKSAIVTVGTGIVSALVNLGLIAWGDQVFGMPLLIQVVLVSMGLDFTAKKTILTNLV